MLEPEGEPLELGVAPTVVGTVIGLIVALAAVYLGARPLELGDVWWHLSLGQVFLEQGLWPASDPLVHTASPDAPRAASWLFDVLVHGMDRGLGLTGVRALHVLSVAAILGLALWRLRVRAGSWLPAFLGLVAFVAVAGGALFELRSDLVGVLCALIVVALVVEPEIPPPAKMGAALVALLLWINADAFWGVGTALLLATLVGFALRWGLSQGPGLVVPFAARTSNRRRAALVAAALVLAVVSPGGLEVRTGLPALGPDSFELTLPGVASVALALAFIATSGLAFARFRTDPTVVRLSALRPEELVLGFASLALLLLYSRLAWLAIFPICYVAAVGTALLRERPRHVETVGWVLAGLTLVFAAGFAWAHEVPRELGRAGIYLARPYTLRDTPVDTIRFLRQTGVEGRLFNAAEDGGFLGYWLAPKLPVFVDGRFESPPSALRDYALISARRGTHDRESFLNLLERYEVDFFLGSGLPIPGERYTTLHLQGVPGWTLVFRTYDQAIYARATQRNAENLARIQRFYQGQGVEMDVAQGLDLRDLTRNRTRWSMANGLLPGRFLEVAKRVDQTSSTPNVKATSFLGLAHALAGDYMRGLASEQATLRAEPGLRGAHERLVFDLLQLGRGAEALATAQRYFERAQTPRAQRFVEVAQHYHDRQSEMRRPGYDPALARMTHALRIMADPDARRRTEIHYRKPPLLPPKF